MAIPTPIFRASHVFGMIGAGLVSSAESTGTFFAAARLSGATAPPAHVLSRSIDLQGIGMLLEGLFGSFVGTTASVENVGLLGLTHIGSRRVVQISTAFMIFFSTFGLTFYSIFNYIYCKKYAKPEDIGAAAEENSSDEELTEDEYAASDDDEIAGKADL